MGCGGRAKISIARLSQNGSGRCVLTRFDSRGTDAPPTTLHCCTGLTVTAVPSVQAKDLCNHLPPTHPTYFYWECCCAWSVGALVRAMMQDATLSDRGPKQTPDHLKRTLPEPENRQVLVLRDATMSDWEVPSRRSFTPQNKTGVGTGGKPLIPTV